MHRHRIAGLTVSSDIDLPGLYGGGGQGVDPDVTIERAPVPNALEAAVATGPTWAMEADRFLLRMEFYINFGLPGLVVGFLCLGWLIGYLDLKAASAEWRGDLKSVFVYFLPAVAVIQPGASIVEISGSAGAAFLIAFGWRWLWSMQADSRPVARPADVAQLPQSSAGGAT